MTQFEELAKEVAQLVDQKNEDYGNCYGVSSELLKLFAPDGIPPDKYNDIAILLRLVEKLKRGFGGEISRDLWVDIIGLGLNGLKLYDDNNIEKSVLHNHSSAFSWAISTTDPNVMWRRQR